MCTIVILRRPDAEWPVLIAANRDEMRDRPWEKPDRHWPDRPDIVAGRDLLAGGTWLGLNDTGVVASILNRHGTLGPQAGKRSRGELVLDALDYPDANEAARALAGLDPAAYRPFNMLLADDRDAFWLKSTGAGRIAVAPLPVGLSMITADDRNDLASPRIAFNLPRFEAAAIPDPEGGDWQGWKKLLASREGPAPSAFMRVDLPSGFGTSSHSLIGLPTTRRAHALKPVWHFAAAGADSPAFEPVKLR
ncbi:MAG: NRDE family protein [Telmatospirillum sp.]|nr:NRDE family protein [Telmatospirillum sp.]